MLDFIIKKALWILGTLLLVSIIFFFLSKNIPGDRVESILQNRGLTWIGTDLDYYKSEYNRLEEELGENLPLFYFSFAPSFKKSEPFKYQNLRINSLCRNLSDQKYPSQQINDLAETLVDLENYCVRTSNRECKSYFMSLFSENGLDNWLAILDNWQTQTDDINVVNLTEHTKEHVIEIRKNKVDFYYPRLMWHGFDNQYHFWLTGFLSNKMGVSIIDGQEINSKIWNALIWTLLLVSLSLLISIAMAIFLSLLMMKYRKNHLDEMVMAILNGIYATPIFWLATIFIVFFTTKEYGVWTDWFPSPIPQIISGNTSVLAVFFARIEYLILPIICIVLKEIPVFTKMIFVGLEGERQKPYATALRGKGIKESRLVIRHLLPNSMIPLITLIGNYLPGSLAGSLIIEVIFNIPGMGRLLYFSLFNGDYGVCFGVLLVITLVTIVVLAGSDILYKWINPKMNTDS